MPNPMVSSLEIEIAENRARAAYVSAAKLMFFGTIDGRRWEARYLGWTQDGVLEAKRTGNHPVLAIELDNDVEAYVDADHIVWWRIFDARPN